MLDAPARRRNEPADVPAEIVPDPSLNLLRRAQRRSFAYSDGAEAERRIYDVIRGARDRGTFSNELAGAIEGWPSEYHLSRQRHCIVRPLGIKPRDRVLEFGCGCGAITRYLGEIGAGVTAIEGAWPRARAAAERCRDLPNVTVIDDDFLQFAANGQFDWVLLVGVAGARLRRLCAPAIRRSIGRARGGAQRRARRPEQFVPGHRGAR